ncbi:MAG: hypothetical protein LKI84_10380 [Lactococcus lactis]|jgi:hypothetical protein|nr:hypothetical protein [Lactococcus lactis]
MLGEINFSIDLGNLWDMIGALGTLFAVLISLYLIFKESIKMGKIKVYGYPEGIENIFAMNEYDEKIIKVRFFNSGKKYIKITELGLGYYNGKDVIPFYFKSEGMKFVEGEKVHDLPIVVREDEDICITFSLLDVKKIEEKNQKHTHMLWTQLEKIIILDL